MAAKAGHEQFFQFLLKAGILRHLKDSSGLTADDVAKRCGHEHLAKSSNVEAVRGGLGDALEDALEDDRRVTRMDWYVVPRQGLLKAFGATRSIVVVTVCGGGSNHQRPIPSGGDCHSYIIEKRQAPPGSHENPRIRNGVFISHYADAAPSRERLQASLSYNELVGDLGGKPLTMQVLWDLAVSLGPYDPVKNSYHHQAHMLFSTCCGDSSKRFRMPNPVFRRSARLLHAMGAETSSVQNVLDKQQPLLRKRLSDNMTLQLGDSDKVDYGITSTEAGVDHSHPFAVVAAELSKWSYSASSVTLENNTGSVVEVRVQGSEEVRKLEKNVSLQLDAAEKSLTVLLKVRASGKFTFINGEVFTGRTYRITSDLSLELKGDLPEHVHVQHVDHAIGSNIVCWSISTTPDTIWVTFRGTHNLADAIVDACLIKCETGHGLQAQAGIWLALTQQKHHALNIIAQEIAKLQKKQPGLRQLVLCGHSLGGGYAILAGLDMLARGFDVSSVVTFGAPQVLVPDKENAIWQRLNGLTTVYVNGWDCVPRLPSCQNWIFSVVKGSLSEKTAIEVGPLRFGINAAGHIIDKFEPHRAVFADFDVTGTLVFVRAGSRKAVVVPNTPDGKQHELLSVEPPTHGAFVLDHHLVTGYLSTIRRLM